jgi:hypothetical protein
MAIVSRKFKMAAASSFHSEKTIMTIVWRIVVLWIYEFDLKWPVRMMILL